MSGADGGTGINPWWRYVEGSIPGVGRYYVNVANQNLVIQSDDMDVHNAGVDLAFRRTANSLSYHDAVGTDGATPSEVGSGWTSTFDAHLSGNAAGGLSVSDIDGARYDYVADGQGHWIPPAGQHATLVTFDGGATYQWTKKSGSSYLFAGPYVNQGNSYEGYNGRLLKISGRNSNTYVSLTYYWTCGDAASNTNLAEIDAVTQAGVTAKLYFADFNGHRLLSKLVWPDGITTVTYDYNAAGGLVNVHKPAPNSSGVPATETYVMTAGNAMIESPRYVASGGTDGGYVAVFLTGKRVQGIQSAGVMNFTPPDGTGIQLQPGVSPTPMQYNWMPLRNVSAGLNEVSDTNGHDTYYYFDPNNRVTEVTEWTGSQWLATFQGWDSSNNLTAEVDARGYETDYAYNASGDTIAIAQPSTTSSTSTGTSTFRPTKLFTYDAHDNVTAYCGPAETHALGKDWSVSSPSVGACPVASGAQQFQFAYPSYQPYGELTVVTSPLGYHRRFAYVGQGTTDYGLPVADTGDSFTQADGTALSESKVFSYDASGNLATYGTGSGKWQLSYDVLNRLTLATDPDNVISRTCYFPDGSVRTRQSALHSLDASICGSNSVSETYDEDGNQATETHHFGSATAATQKWYDGADRLTEVVEPHDLTDYQNYSWMVRYIYDLGPYGSSPTINGNSVSGHGNLVKTMEYLPPTAPGQPTNPTGTPQWIDVRGGSFDALDRAVASYEAAFGNTPKQTSVYDGNGQLGFLSQTTNAVGQGVATAYDEVGRKVSDTYSGDAGLTPNRSFTYDISGGAATITASDFGTQAYTYDAEGRKTSSREPAGGSVDSPATVTYSYYPNGMRQTLAISSSAFAIPVSMAYSYRADGKAVTESFTNQYAAYPFSVSYTPAGRIQQRSDPLTGHLVPSFPINNGMSGSMPPVTLVPQSYQYDANGSLNGMTIPRGGTYSAFTRDPEGEITSVFAYAVPSSPYAGATEAISYTVRGEVSKDGMTCAGGPCTRTPVTKHYFNGLNYTFEADLRSGQNYGNSNEATTGIDFKYDGAGRLTGSVSSYSGGSPLSPTWASVPYSRTYDAEDHLRAQVVSGGQYVTSFAPCTGGAGLTPSSWYPTSMYLSYWPNGHAAVLTDSTDGTSSPDTPSTTMHWDGDTLLYASTSNGVGGHIANVYLGTDAMFTMVPNVPTSAIQVYDRDWSGTAVSSHSLQNGSYGYGAWQGQGPAATVNCRTGGVANVYPISSNQDGVVASGAASKKNDGYIADVITLQGVRTYDPIAGQWTTPDTYAGNVHDPMSQKPYMWNRNNPYTYSDPTGFTSCVTLVCSTDGGESAPPDERIAMDSGAKPAYSDILNALRNAIDKAFRDVDVNGGNLRDAIEREINASIGEVEGGKYKVSWRAANKQGFTELRNATSTISVYESTDHGGHGDGGWKVRINTMPGKMEDRMGWSRQLRATWSTYGSANFSAPRLPYVPVGFGKIGEEE